MNKGIEGESCEAIWGKTLYALVTKSLHSAVRLSNVGSNPNSAIYKL